MKSFFVLLSMLALACETPATAYDKDDSKTEQHVPDAGEESGGVQKNSIMEKLEDVQFEPADKYGEQEGEFQPNFPAVYWDFDEFVDLLYGDVVIINFDALPSGPAVAPGFDQVTRQVTGALLTGEEWRDLGAVFSSPAGAALAAMWATSCSMTSRTALWGRSSAYNCGLSNCRRKQSQIAVVCFTGGAGCP